MAHVTDHRHRAHQTDRAADGELLQAVCACGHRGPVRDTVLGAIRALNYPSAPRVTAQSPPDPTFLARTRMSQAVAADIDEEPF